MLTLENIKVAARVRGLRSDRVVNIVQATPAGADALAVYYKDDEGDIGERMLFRSDEAGLELVSPGRAFAFDAPGDEFILGLEACRISQAALFDPMMAVHTSTVEPLPHQIAAVYEVMLPRQPLRFVLADDPGAGKTIMAGLLVSELLARADARRVLIVCPGGLTEQWQDELQEKFGLGFDIFSREKQEQCASGNYFAARDRLICRLDQLARSEEYQLRLKATQWDIVIVDEAHKLSAGHFGDKVNKTKRFLLGELLGDITRHFLLITATPHNGKEEDFQIWLSLLDSDRFHGRFRDGVHQADVSDMMRRMIKEELLKFDGAPLFPERRAYSVAYTLSAAEAALYNEVTDYVRNEMNRADKLDGKRRGTVGFALTLLQRRLASSPAAICQSLQRRRKRLAARLEETRHLARGHAAAVAEALSDRLKKQFEPPEDLDELDEELSAAEYERYAEQIADEATAAKTIPELEAEIKILRGLEQRAQAVARSGSDRKWEELSRLLQDEPLMRAASGDRRKLIVFTEHKDTLDYLAARIGNQLGDAAAVVKIHGGIGRDNRRKAQEEFRNNKDARVLVATDAAGEGVNLQNANLMINYDLPWNPNRLEQRFGRIHRIGQTEVCHLWNLVAAETREGRVFARLLDKLEKEKAALGGKVFDILGEAFDNRSLKELLLEAIRHGERPQTRDRIDRAIDNALDTDRLREIMRRAALAEQSIGLKDLYAVREKMEKAQARKLQPYFIRSFFAAAFADLKGEMRPREPGRYEARYVPAAIRERDRVIGEGRTPVLKKYQRICFEKERIRAPGKPMADFIHPGHPLMRAVTDLTLSAHRGKLKRGAALVDPNDEGEEPRTLFMLDHSVRESGDARARTVSRRLQFINIDRHGHAARAGWAPHLDLAAITEEDLELVRDIVDATRDGDDWERVAVDYASRHLLPEHYAEVKARRDSQTKKTLAAVSERLVKEIAYWDGRCVQLAEQAAAGKRPRMQPETAKRRADELNERLKQRRRELEEANTVVAAPPVVIGAALVIPRGLIARRKGEAALAADAQSRKHIETVAMNAVMAAERRLGHRPEDVSAQKCGWDITSRPPPAADGALEPDRHIEVKGRARNQATITVSRNEIVYALNQRETFMLAIVVVDGDDYDGPFYLRDPFASEPDFGVASVNYDLRDLLAKSQAAEQTV